MIGTHVFCYLSQPGSFSYQGASKMQSQSDSDDIGNKNAPEWSFKKSNTDDEKPAFLSYGENYLVF